MWKRVQLNSNELLFARHANILETLLLDFLLLKENAKEQIKSKNLKDDESEEARY